MKECQTSVVCLTAIRDAWDVSVDTCDGCEIIESLSLLVGTFGTKSEAEAFIARTYGLHRVARDGEPHHAGYWLC